MVGGETETKRWNNSLGVTQQVCGRSKIEPSSTESQVTSLSTKPYYLLLLQLLLEPGIWDAKNTGWELEVLHLFVLEQVMGNSFAYSVLYCRIKLIHKYRVGCPSLGTIGSFPLLLTGFPYLHIDSLKESALPWSMFCLSLMLPMSNLLISVKVGIEALSRVWNYFELVESSTSATERGLLWSEDSICFKKWGLNVIQTFEGMGCAL